jgi:ABC-type polysaccharide/polyol phosphate transport system ATPase subunit
MSTPAIELRQVSKRYILHKQKPFMASEIFNRWILRKDRREQFWALQNITFSIRPGEAVAFIGHNGAGKSTLLGVIAGTIQPTGGTVERNGRIGALLELGAGFHPDLTGRENIYLNASLLGLTRRMVEDRFDQILAFSELEEFIDVPLRNYSSGMQMRLGFSVAIHIDPEILILDEVFAVGDASFQEKCIARIRDLRKAQKTLLFVTHTHNYVSEFCNRAIWLDHGRIMADGHPADVLTAHQAYFRQLKA